MFDTFRGLPVHVLVVHAVVVLTPLMAVLTALVAWLPRWRAKVAWLVVVGNVVVVVLVKVAQLSGNQLLGRIGSSPAIEHHLKLGDQMLWFALAMLAASVLVALARNSSAPLPTAAAVIAVVASLAAIGWVIRTGEAGSNAVWKDIIANTNPK
ncbi:DUF2231 domain-containing protein [Angustibacter sp. McL0619]|uniref:DUF2231 domain-containing protein n=1 Tax=Angustibacter sp. McL0619 TaxID=3415676 RepID=UPI003CF6994C